jgi:hypothetical protein
LADVGLAEFAAGSARRVPVRHEIESRFWIGDQVVTSWDYPETGPRTVLGVIVKDGGASREYQVTSRNGGGIAIHVRETEMRPYDFKDTAT